MRCVRLYKLFRTGYRSCYPALVRLARMYVVGAITCGFLWSRGAEAAWWSWPPPLSGMVVRAWLHPPWDPQGDGR